MKRFLLAVFISILMFISAYITMKVITRPSGIVVEKWRVLDCGFDKKLKKDLPCFFSFKLKSPSYLFITTDIPKTEGVRYLYFPQIDVSYLEVYANGNLIGSFGSKYTKTGRIWYQPLVYELPAGTDKISLKMYGVFTISLGTHAVILGEKNLWRREKSLEVRTFILSHLETSPDRDRYDRILGIDHVDDINKGGRNSEEDLHIDRIGLVSCINVATSPDAFLEHGELFADARHEEGIGIHALHFRSTSDHGDISDPWLR